MGFTNQIDQSNITATSRILEENAANRRQTQQLTAQASENQKTRDFTEKQYNIKAGEDYLEKNPVTPLSEDKIEKFGSEVQAIYAENVQKILDAKKKVMSGNVAERMDGQEEITKANESLKKLAFEYGIISDDTQSYLQQEDIVGDSKNAVVTAVSEAFLNKNVKIVLAKDAGKKGMGRYIEYKDDTGVMQYIAVEDYKNILNDPTKRVDTEAWVKTVSANLETSEKTDPQGRTVNELLNPEARNSAIDELLNDPKKLKALQVQFKENDVTKIKAILDARLLASKKYTKDDEATYRAPASTSSSDKREDLDNSISQRRYDVELLAGGNEKDLQNFFVGKSAKYGVGENKGVASTRFVGDEIVFTYDDNTERRIKNTSKNINDLFNEFTYNINETKIDFASLGTRQPINVAGGVKSPNVVATVDSTPTGVRKALELVVNDQGGVTEPNQLVKAIKTQYKELLTSEVLTNTGLWDMVVNGKQVKLFGKNYDVRTKSGLDIFIKDVSNKLDILRNTKKATTTGGGNVR